MTQKKILITGASSGIGYALAKAYAEKGYAVYLVARRIDKLKKLQIEITTTNGQCWIQACDVTDPNQIHQAALNCKKVMGAPDKLILNAGISYPVDLDPLNRDEIAQVMNTNFWGAIDFIKEFLPDFLEKKQGHIIGISSMASFIATAGSGAYSASKASLRLMLESLRLQLKPYQIDVSIICPGFIKTPMTDQNLFPMPFVMDLDPAIQKIMKAIHQKKAIYCFPKKMVWLIYLKKILPRFITDPILLRHLYQKEKK